MHILECNFDGYASFLFKDAEEEDKWLSPRDRFNLFDGTPRNGKYPVPQGIRNRVGKEKRSNVLPDFTHIGLTPIPTFSERAVQALGDMLSRNGELAPIKMNEAMQYYGFNPTRIVDVVDEEKSTIAYFSSGRLMDLDMERGCTMTAPFYSLATIACLLIFRLPHRILHRLHPIIRLFAGDAVFHRLFGDGDRDSGGRGAQIIHRRQQRCAYVLRVDL